MAAASAAFYARFPTADLAFARGWAAAAPSGWAVELDASDEGADIVWIYAPGSDDTAFCVSRQGGAALTEELIQPHGIRPVGSHATLPEALLALCPVGAAELAKVRGGVSEKRPH